VFSDASGAGLVITRFDGSLERVYLVRESVDEVSEDREEVGDGVDEVVVAFRKQLRDSFFPKDRVFEGSRSLSPLPLSEPRGTRH
jgi:hypothetical protein